MFDLQVEEVNHYITDGGFVNKNCFDEGTQFIYSQVRFLMGWLRSSDPSQRTRVIIATNPPMNPKGCGSSRCSGPGRRSTLASGEARGAALVRHRRGRQRPWRLRDLSR